MTSFPSVGRHGDLLVFRRDIPTIIYVRTCRGVFGFLRVGINQSGNRRTGHDRDGDPEGAQRPGPGHRVLLLRGGWARRRGRGVH